MESSRRDLGLPSDWKRVEQWLQFSGPVPNSTEFPVEPFISKWPQIPVLTNYDLIPSPDFWSNFPKRELPCNPETAIHTDRLEQMIETHKNKMTSHQYLRSKRALSFLKDGAPACQVDTLPACFVKNAHCAIKHGQEVTETIATWVDKGYAAGPFEGPPCPHFRVNPIIAVVQPGKVRPVLNVSAPDGSSFNSNVNEQETEKVTMASAMQFAQNLLDCGPNSVMSKLDLTAAYKQVPARVQDLRLQGFRWLGKYFVETRQIFGAKTSVSNYDVVGETLKLLALCESTCPAHLVLRQVDDVPIVSPKSTGWCENFTERYLELCKYLNVELAPPCPMNDKAFINATRGKVLGIMFDANDLTWRMSEKKIQKSCSVSRMQPSPITAP